MLTLVLVAGGLLVRPIELAYATKLNRLLDNSLDNSLDNEKQNIFYLEEDPLNTQIAYENYEREIQEKKAREAAQLIRTRNAEFNPCSCVSYARYRSGINVGPIGIAKNHPVNSAVPTVGTIVVMDESPSGHLAVVTTVDSEYITVAESNYVPCTVTEGRKIPINSPLIRGYYH